MRLPTAIAAAALIAPLVCVASTPDIVVPGTYRKADAPSAAVVAQPWLALTAAGGQWSLARSRLEAEIDRLATVDVANPVLRLSARVQGAVALLSSMFLRPGAVTAASEFPLPDAAPGLAIRILAEGGTPPNAGFAFTLGGERYTLLHRRSALGTARIELAHAETRQVLSVARKPQGRFTVLFAGDLDGDNALDLVVADEIERPGVTANALWLSSVAAGDHLVGIAALRDVASTAPQTAAHGATFSE